MDDERLKQVLYDRFAEENADYRYYLDLANEIDKTDYFGWASVIECIAHEERQHASLIRRMLDCLEKKHNF